ncbi:MBL fold metallo-hydrolase [Peribacillus sp. SCS-155]|uniref:MBL fold metallo-hydrolase n=1 Tax=Peribacillus sedimenti TaxID=3115297 RepID=UPI0039064802
MIDTGNPGMSSFNELKSKLSDNGLHLQDFDSIILSHMHTDHSGGVSEIQKEAALPVYVHEKAKYAITGGKTEFNRTNEFFYSFMQQCGVRPEGHQPARKYKEEIWHDVIYVKDGDVIPIAGINFEVLYVPGHSQTDILLWNPETGDTIAGDHLIADFSVNAFIEPPPYREEERPKSLLQYRASLDRVKTLPFGTIYPGHGEPFTNHAGLIEKRFLEQENRCVQIQNALETGEKTVYELCKLIYPRLQGNTVFLGLSQIQGHLDLMESRYQVAASYQGPICYYKLIK